VSELEVGLADQIGALTERLGKAVEIMKESKESDGARWAAADKEREETAKALDELVEAKAKADRETATAQVIAEHEERIKTLMATREPSKAWLVGNQSSTPEGVAPGAFITAIRNSRSVDYKEQEAGKAALASMGVTEADPDSLKNYHVAGDPGNFAKAKYSLGKATLGTTTATGLAIVPNNVVARLVEIATAENIYRRLMNWIPGVATAGVDIPLEAAAPLRAVVAPFGSTKENVDITYLRYTATLYTIGRIHDVGNQLLRFSAGAAEADVVSRLGRAFALGEAYYILQGAGSTEPLGLLTAIGTTGSYVTTDSSGFATPAASFFGAISSAIGTLENRARHPNAVVTNPADFWTYLTLEGGTSRPYATSLLQGLGTSGQIDSQQNPLMLYGLPIYRDPNMPAGSALLGEFQNTNVFTGLGYRIDSSSEAGTRWDTNETGFRGEEELGFTGSPWSNAGMFQRIISVGS
jgi:HK97 family phage major capsid protein